MTSRVPVSLALLVVLAGSAQAQTTDASKPGDRKEIPDQILKPFLWRIEGETPNYIFGTIHVAEPRALKLHPLAQEAFDSADAAMFEIDFREAGSQMAAIALPPGEKLSDVLSDDLIARLDKQLDRVVPPGLSGTQFRGALNARPIVWPLLIQQLQAQKRFQQPPLDMQLYTKARQADKVVGGLEDPKAQLKELFSLSNEEQREFVRASIQAMEDAQASEEDQLMETIGYYLRGDGKAFHEYFMEDLSAGDLSAKITEKIIDGLLYKRNKRMADAIVKAMKKNPERSHFFAVGTAHMLGPKNVLDYLKKQGVNTTLVEPARAGAAAGQ